MSLVSDNPQVWHQRLEDWELPAFQPYWDVLQNPEVLVYCHNALFEMAISQALMQKTWGIPCPDLSRFRCTMSLARRAQLPASLEKLGEVLELSTQKDKRGKALIRKFSMMQPARMKPTKKNPQGVPEHRIRPEDDPAAFQEFMDYCLQDVCVEQAVAKKLAYFDEPINNANYSLDAVINARGVPVNLAALRHAQKLIEEETEIVSKKFRELVGFEVTQNAKILEWAKENGANLDNLQAETIELYLAQEEVKIGEPGIVELALRMKQSIAYAAIKKVKTMLNCAGPHDNRIRGMLNHHGASTGRWTASLVQFQNMKRSTIKDWAGKNISELAYRDICNEVSLEMLRLTWGDPLEVISSCIRHFIQNC